MSKLSKIAVLTSLASVTFAALLTLSAIHTIDKLKPMSVFLSYYSCRIQGYVLHDEERCVRLPTVSVNLPEYVNAQQLGAPDPLALQVFFQTNGVDDHIYAHRTNSPERIRLYQKYYSAFEFDAIWDADAQAVDIFHWPERESMGFHLTDFLALAPGQGRYWMDIKNLDLDNVSAFGQHLKALMEQINNLSMDNIIIESKNVHAVAFLQAQGFVTSYYLPSLNPTHTQIDNCRNNQGITRTIVDNIHDHPTQYISFPYAQQAYVDNCLLPLVGHIDQISWGGLPFAIPEGATDRYHAYIVDHSLEYSEL